MSDWYLVRIACTQMRLIATDVAWSVCMYVCLLVTTVDPSKADETIETIFNYVRYFMRYRVIYFQCLCYLALPLCIVSMHLTRCAL